jgi:hypothetical protein
MIHRRPIVLLMAATLVAAAACSTPGTGGSAPSGASSGPGASAPLRSGAAACPTTPAPQTAPAGWDVTSQHPSVFPQIINPSGAIACGHTRLMFSFLDTKNVPVASPDRSVAVKVFDLGADPATPVASGTATFIWAIEPTVGVYVVDVDLPTAGSYGAEFTTKVGTGAPEQIRLGFDVQPASSVIAVGDKAPASVTPTLADVGGDPARISTDPAPVKAFYETSIAEAAASGKPFVVAFATPKFCVSKQCGPTLDRLKPIAARHPEVTFINVEPYQLTFQDGQLQPVLTGDPPQLTPTDATNEWHLPTEPWVFVVDRHGVVSASFMLIFSDAELEDALKAVE